LEEEALKPFFFSGKKERKRERGGQKKKHETLKCDFIV
jgi:hypothetical protein